MVIFLNGSINSGKSTIARLLSKKIEKAAIVEIDSLRDFIQDINLEDSISLNLENAALLVHNFISHGFNVIVPYPLSRKNYEFLVEKLGGLKEDLYFFTLAPTIEKAQSDTKDRELTDWERDRIKHHYTIGIASPDFGETIDSTNHVPTETAEYIFSKLKLN
jgi:hypothetical protein